MEKQAPKSKNRKHESIRIRVTYLTENLAKIVGKKEETIRLAAGARSGDLIDFMIERHPELFEKCGPGYLGFTRNGEKPKVFTRLFDGDHYEFADWADGEIFRDEAVKRLKELGAVMDLPYGEFKPPAWWECVWRRIPCGKDDCRLCGKINRDRLRHITKGEDPDSMGSVMADMGNSLGEAMAMVKQHAAEMGVDLENIQEQEFEEPPEPKELSLYCRAENWLQDIEKLGKSAEETGALWTMTVAAADLFWYRNTLATKTYRQLYNRWNLDRGDEGSNVDYQYTKYVLGECLRILKKSLADLSEFDSPEKEGLARALGQLHELEKPILEI